MNLSDDVLLVAGKGNGPGQITSVAIEHTMVTDLSDAVERISRGRAAGRRITLAVIAPSVERPFAAARDLRRVDSELGLVFLTERGEAAAMETRLGLVPELRGATVVDADIPAAELEATLRRATATASRRHRVRSAVADMNRRLLQHQTRATTPGPQRVSESFLAALTRYAPDAIVAVDVDGRSVSLNEAATRLLGVSAADAEGVELTELVEARPEGALGRLIESAVREEPQRVDLWLVRPDGREVRVSITAAPISDQRDEPAGVVIFARDTTLEHRSAERLRELQKAESLATLAGGVAHDFNNLLVSVMGWAEIARDEADDEETVAAALESISASAERAADLARAMLAYSGRGEFQFGPADVSAVVDEMAELLRSSVNRKTELHLDLTDGLPEVEADTTQLRQVLLNLVTNADEALGDAGGTIRVRTDVREPPAAPETGDTDLRADRYVVLEVADDGPGMDERTLARVFEPFFSTKFPGRGLGLAASHGIARAHGGALLVESEVGRGTAFTLYLPIPEAA